MYPGRKFFGLALLLLLRGTTILGQDCPANFGFEKGTFENWECFAGKIVKETADNNNSPTHFEFGASAQADFYRHRIIESSPENLPDYYSGGNIRLDKFPNGSNYCVQLGNDDKSSGAERLSYTFTIPSPIYSLTYYYALVLQNGGHGENVQPKFTAKTYDVNTGEEIECGSFDFTASAQTSDLVTSPILNNAVYRSWTPVTLNLSNMAGRRVRIEFTVNDCPNNGHFGYAYIDLDDNCDSPITGNTKCSTGDLTMTLKAPEGMRVYKWYDQNMNLLPESSNKLTIATPPAGTVYSMFYEPYLKSQCASTVQTTIRDPSPVPIKFVLNSTVLRGCKADGVNLTDSAVTAGSSPGIKFTYHTDPAGTDFVAGARAVKRSDRYYIKARFPSGCYAIKAIDVEISDPPSITVINPPPVCFPQTVNITQGVVSGLKPKDIVSYWTDPGASDPLLNPTAVDKTSTYYIKVVNERGCHTIKSVFVFIDHKPVLKPKTTVGCGFVDLTKVDVTTSGLGNMIPTYWKNPECTVAIPDPARVTTGGKYFIKVTNSTGCFDVAPVEVTVNFLAELILKKQDISLDYPGTINLFECIVPVSGLTYSYWKDEKLTIPVENPSAVGKTGNYYIKAETAAKCSQQLLVKLTIIPPKLSYTETISSTFTPNGDGYNDQFKLTVTGYYQTNAFKIYDRWGQLIFLSKSTDISWDGKDAATGTYYWTLEATDTFYQTKISRSGSITLVR